MTRLHQFVQTVRDNVITEGTPGDTAEKRYSAILSAAEALIPTGNDAEVANRIHLVIIFETAVMAVVDHNLEQIPWLQGPATMERLAYVKSLCADDVEWLDSGARMLPNGEVAQGDSAVARALANAGAFRSVAIVPDDEEEHPVEAEVGYCRNHGRQWCPLCG